MSSLLPANATELERTLAAMGIRATDLPVLIRELWNPESCPLALLPWLAWAWSADEWSTSWTERQQRNTVKSAIAVQRIKGTIGAVRSALGALGLSIRVQEWFNQTPAAAPYTFSVHVETSQTPVIQADIIRAMAVIERSKNLRSHLQSILVSASSSVHVHAAAVTHIGHELDISYQPPQLVISELTLPLDGTVTSGDTTWS